MMVTQKETVLKNCCRLTSELQHQRTRVSQPRDVYSSNSGKTARARRAGGTLPPMKGSAAQEAQDTHATVTNHLIMRNFMKTETIAATSMGNRQYPSKQSAWKKPMLPPSSTTFTVRTRLPNETTANTTENTADGGLYPIDRHDASTSVKTMGPQRSQLRSACACCSRSEPKGNTTNFRFRYTCFRSREIVSQRGSSRVLGLPLPPPPKPVASLPPNCGSLGSA
mmetsp:Transcript_16277/g.48806  ORF Transcript_16277/g.48806 Transcript_16277/m.48806 type:complete len:224 (-) Transcript_16277:297-968(-)